MLFKPFVLSGGGARGFAHLGVVQALSEHGYAPEAIAGTSAGSIAGAFLANGFTPEEVRELFIKKMSLTLLEWNSFQLGLVSLKKIGKFLQDNFRYKNFEDLPIPLHVSATNFLDGRQVIFNQGHIVPAVLAACSIPAIFPPITIDHVPYVDGGMSNNLPVEPFADRKHDVIAVYVNPVAPFHSKASIPEVLDRAVHLSFREIVGRSAEGCLMFIEPPELHAYGLFDINKLSAIYDTGYNYTLKMLEDMLPPAVI